MSNATPFTQADSKLADPDKNMKPAGYKYANAMHADDVIWPFWYDRAEFDTWGRMLMEDRKASLTFHRELLTVYAGSNTLAAYVRRQIDDAVTYGTDKGQATVY